MLVLGQGVEPLTLQKTGSASGGEGLQAAVVLAPDAHFIAQRPGTKYAQLSTADDVVVFSDWLSHWACLHARLRPQQACAAPRLTLSSSGILAGSGSTERASSAAASRSQNPCPCLVAKPSTRGCSLMVMPK